MAEFVTHGFAQNYPQLMGQAQQAEFTDTELRQLRDAFELALEFSNGIYRMQGVPLLNHLVTSSSIVLKECKDIEMVIAALLHAAYVLHRFKNSSRSSRFEVRRDELRRRFGAGTEELIWAFDRTPWYRREALERHIDRFDQSTTFQRRVLVLRLANEIDDYLDNAAGYGSFVRWGGRSDDCLKLCITLAEKLELFHVREELVAIRDRDEEPETFPGQRPQYWLRIIVPKVAAQLDREFWSVCNAKAETCEAICYEYH